MEYWNKGVMERWKFQAVGAGLSRDCFEAVSWGRGVKPLLLACSLRDPIPDSPPSCESPLYPPLHHSTTPQLHHSLLPLFALLCALCERRTFFTLFRSRSRSRLISAPSSFFILLPFLPPSVLSGYAGSGRFSSSL